MGFTHTFVRSCATSATADPLKQTTQVTAPKELNLSLPIPAQAGSPLSGDNYPLSWSCDRSKLKSIAIKATRDGTLYTNDVSGGSPQDTIPLKAGQVLDWILDTDGLAACPFSGDVTSAFFTPPVGGDDTDFDISALSGN